MLVIGIMYYSYRYNGQLDGAEVLCVTITRVCHSSSVWLSLPPTVADLCVS